MTSNSVYVERDGKILELKLAVAAAVGVWQKPDVPATPARRPLTAHGACPSH